MVRKILLQEDDMLKDKFCDANDLLDAWNSMRIPENVLEFLCVLLNVDDKNFYRDDETDSNVSEAKRRKIMAMYQIMFYIVNNGEKKTPLHVINAEMIHDTCRSKILITGFNHLGLCMSHPELLRYHKDLASYILSKSSNDVPLRSHFHTDIHTTAAFDNFDHNEHTPSGLGSSHDTVSILIQDKPNGIQRKPNISETSVQHGCKTFVGPLPCQNLLEFHKSSKKIEIPNDYDPVMKLFTVTDPEYEDIKKIDYAWELSRLDLSNESVKSYSDVQTMPSWSSFNSVVSDKKRKVQQVGFLPVLPYPATKYETVYTALKNVNNILEQLTQNEMAIFCDEGVYHIAREIILQRPNEFLGLVLCLGSFHMLKTVLGYIGKYLSGSGCRTIWTKTKVFGLGVVESVLNGHDYERSIDGITLLSECVSRLQWVEFFETNTVKYSHELNTMAALKFAVSEKNREESRRLLQ